MKTCNKCGETKPLTEFNKAADGRDGLRAQCKACRKIANAARYAANPEKYKADSAKWVADNIDKSNEYQAEYKTKWNSENPDYHAEWRTDNSEACRIYNHNYRARKRENGGTLSKGLSAKLFTIQRGKCACGCKQPLGDDYHMDHIMPLALGGTNTDNNIQLLRAKCNLQKNAKHPINFMQQRGFLL